MLISSAFQGYASLHRQACRLNGCAARHDGVPIRHHVASGDRAGGEGGHPLRLHDFARDGDAQRRSPVDPADQRGQPRHHAGAAAALDPAPGRWRSRAARRCAWTRPLPQRSSAAAPLPMAECFASASGKRHSPCR